MFEFNVHTVQGEFSKHFTGSMNTTVLVYNVHYIECKRITVIIILVKFLHLSSMSRFAIVTVEVVIVRDNMLYKQYLSRKKLIKK